ncbi:MAG: toll/interleukin-1 receptor domain-containing protein [Fibromonadales bacterium]|nr:toll/interleukin-1 receptor domain-containing protein [Fibromonadales bacterium]
MSNFKIFISYRRKGGYDIAKLIYDRLRLDGYSVFFDIDSLENGSFDKELEKRVKKCKDFILILNSGIFDRFSKKDYNEEEDWVRQEIICALKANKNIVPLVLDGFAFPKTLPDDIKDINRKNTLELSPRHFEATYEKMKESFLLSKPRWTVRNKKHIKNFIAIIILAFAVYLFFIAYNYHSQEMETIKAIKEQELNSIKTANELEKKHITDSINTALNSTRCAVSDSIKYSIADSIKLSMADSIKHSVLDSISKAQKTQTPLPTKTKPQATKTKTVSQKSTKTTKRSTR